jgi:hypothetical protein
MTMMSHVLLSLRGDEDWATWGERWYRHAPMVSHLAFVPDWSGPRPGCATARIDSSTGGRGCTSYRLRRCDN